ncbi:hypothetical protein BY996DRAFT_4578559 [Phakopsora pachyrhizi]|nr:hypothetical protein BY996DRAFT_4578559 [Phakopsora pachyrhizi]
MPPSAHFFVGPSSVSTPVTQYTNQHDPNISTLDHDDEQPNPPTHSGLEIHLDSDLVILRAGAANPETELQEDDPSRNTCPSSYLDGTVILTLSEPTQISDVILKLQVICRSDYIDALNCKRYRSDYVVLTHNLNLINNNNSNSNININNASSAPSDYFDQQHPSSSSSNKNPNRLSAGVYRFKFSIELNSDLPPSLITFSRSGAIFYKLRALTASHSSQHLESPKVYPKILKTFDSLFSNSFTQSLEIENVWPEKLSYEIGLPRKSFSAGETIPITVKFRPLVKGVKVKTLVATIRESVTLLGKPGGIPHAEMRDAAEFKFEFGPQAGNRNELINQSSDLPTGTSTGPLNPRGEMLETASDLSNLTRKLEEVSNLRDSTKSDCPKGLANSNAQEGSEFDENLSGEIEEVLGIDLPVTTTPSHPQPPIIVHHKLKFSVIIHNPDGHKSELRCALPLNVLPHELAQEVRLASSGTIQGRIHYNPSGSVLDHPLNRFEENILPSYPEHIFDRLPSITRLGDLVHHASPSAFYVPAPWSHITSSPSTPSADFQSPPGLFPPHSQYHHLIPQSTCSTPSASTRRSSCSTGYFTNPNQFQPSQLPSPQQQQSSSTSEPESSLSAGNDNHGR